MGHSAGEVAPPAGACPVSQAKFMSQEEDQDNWAGRRRAARFKTGEKDAFILLTSLWGQYKIIYK